MSTKVLLEIANQLVENCKNGKEAEGLATLYSDSAVSVEAVSMQKDGNREVVGLDAIRAKHAWWELSLIHI